MGFIDRLKELTVPVRSVIDTGDGLGDRLIAAAIFMENARDSIRSHPQFKHHAPDLEVLLDPIESSIVNCYRTAGSYQIVSAESQ